MTASTTAEDPGVYVVLSGDTTGRSAALGRELAPALGLPLLNRATLTTALAGSLDGSDPRLQQALTTALLALAADCRGGVLDGVAPDDVALRELDGQIVQVLCLTDASAAAATGAGATAPWPVVTVDLTGPVDVNPVADHVVAALAHRREDADAAEQWVVWREGAGDEPVEVTRRDSRTVAESVAATMAAASPGTRFPVTRA